MTLALSQGLPETNEVFDGEAEAAEVASLCPTDALRCESDGSSSTLSRTAASPACAAKRQLVPAQQSGGTASYGHTRPTEASAIRCVGALQGVYPRSHRRRRRLRLVSERARAARWPSYNLHRFGIFITPTPRQADVLLVVGPVTRQMRDPLKAAYDAMPAPKRVVAVGACAASGGLPRPGHVLWRGGRRYPGRPGCARVSAATIRDRTRPARRLWAVYNPTQSLAERSYMG